MNRIFQYYKPSLGQSWLLVALVIAGSLVMGLALPHAPQSLTYFLMMCFPLGWCWWMGRQEAAIAEISGRKPLPFNAPHFGKLSGPAFFVLAAIAMLALTVVIEPTTAFIPMPDSIKAVFEKAFIDSPLWDMILSTCILAPLLEEFLCRGMMLRGMLAHRITPWKAIAWSAFLFAFMHMNPWQSIPAFLIGLFLGWVYWRTHCLWATIFLHCLNNVISTVISRLWPDLSIDAGLKDILPPTTYWLVYAGCVVVLVVTIYLLHEKTLPANVSSPVEA